MYRKPGSILSSVSNALLRFVQGWLKSRAPQEGEIILSLLEQILDDLLTYVSQNLHPKMDVLQCNIIRQVRASLKGTIGRVSSNLGNLEMSRNSKRGPRKSGKSSRILRKMRFTVTEVLCLKPRSVSISK